MSTPVAVACDARLHRASDADDPRRPGGIRRGARLYPGRSAARLRLLDAMTDLARATGRERVTTSEVYQHAGLGRRVFESEFASIEECFEEAVEAALDHLLASVAAATDGAGPEWGDRVGAAVVGFLRFLDEQPARAWMSIVEPLSGGDRSRFARRNALERLGDLLGGGPARALESDRPRPRTAPDVAGGLWEMARQYLWDGPDAVDLDDVAGSTIFLALSPYVGRRAAMRAATGAPAIGRPDRFEGDGNARAADLASPGSESPVGRGAARILGDAQGERDPLATIPMLTALAAETLAYLHDHPGAAGIDVSDAIGVSHASQTSRHLGRLEALDLVWSRRDGRYKRWELTDRGRAVVERLRDR